MSPGPTGRAAGILGGLWGAAAAGYLVATAVDVNTPSLLQNASARRGDLGYAALAMVLGLVTALALWRRRGPAGADGAALAVAGLAFAALATTAVAVSDRETLLPTLLLVVSPPVALLVVGALLICAARSSVTLVATMAALVGLAGVAAAIFLTDEADEAIVASGIHDDWEQETAVDNAFVDEGGRVWGVRPWAQAEPATILLLDPGSGEFRETADRRPGWPPTVLGADATGSTWIVSSEIDDPFQPVFERYADGVFSLAPVPATPLPPLDAVVLDGRRSRLLAMHSDFAVPAGLVLEVFEAGQWRTEPTPLVAGSRASALDLAVDAGGRVWVWHDAEPNRVHRYDGCTWTLLPLPVDLETTTDLTFPPISMDAHRTFFPAPDGQVWLYDRDGNQLITVSDAGEVSGRRPLPDGCVPLAFDPEGRVWCGDGDGLSIVSPDGQVLYDSRADGVQDFRIQSVAIGADRAWVLVRRHRAEQLLAFDHRAALARD